MAVLEEFINCLFISRFHTKPDNFFFQFEQFSQNGCFPLKLGNSIFIELRRES